MFANPIDSSKPDKAYAKAQVKEVMSFRDFVSHIAEHGGYKRGQVKVMLDELGNFWLSLSSEGAESCEAFNAKNITGVNIIFTPGEDFENLLSRATFNPVPSRSLQNAAIKAEKKGEKTIDIEAVKKKPATDGGDNSGKPATPSKPSDTTPDGSDGNTENSGATGNPDGTGSEGGNDKFEA